MLSEHQIGESCRGLVFFLKTLGESSNLPKSRVQSSVHYLPPFLFSEEKVCTL